MSRLSELSRRKSTQRFAVELFPQSEGIPARRATDVQWLRAKFENGSSRIVLSRKGLNWSGISGLVLALVASAIFWIAVIWGTAQIWR